MGACPRWMALGLLLVGVFLSWGSSSTRTIRQVGLVPHAAAPFRSGQDLHDGRVQLFAQGSILAGGKMDATAKETESSEIARYQFDQGIRVRLGQNWDLGGYWLYGSTANVLKRDELVLAGPTQGIFGMGITSQYSVELASFLRLGLGLDTPFYVIPGMEYDATKCDYTDLDSCGSGSKDMDLALGLSFSVLPSIRLAPWIVLFGGVNLGVLPTVSPVIAKTTSTLKDGTVWRETGDDEIEYRSYAAFGGGVEVQLGRIVRLQTSVFCPYEKDFISPAAVFNMGLSVALGRSYYEPKPPPPAPISVPPSSSSGPSFFAPPPVPPSLPDPASSQPAPSSKSPTPAPAPGQEEEPYLPEPAAPPPPSPPGPGQPSPQPER